MLVKKEVISPGVYYYTDRETGLPRTLHATPELIRYWHDTGKEMLRAGLSVPVPMEHDEKALPRTTAQKAREQLENNAGWVSDYTLENDTLFSVCDILDPKIEEKVKNQTVKWTSPYFTSFVDGAGKSWDGVIGHLALTSRPRITKQQPFPSVAAAMSYAATLPQETEEVMALPKGQGFSLSRAGLIAQKAGRLAPVYPVAFSLTTGIAMAAEDLKKGKKPPSKPESNPAESLEGDDGAGADAGADLGAKPKSGAKPGGPPKDTPESRSTDLQGDVPPANPLEALQEETLIDGDGDIGVDDVIYELMEILGLPIPDHANREDMREAVYLALMSAIKVLSSKPSEPEQQEPERMNPIIQEQQPMYMSLEQVNAITDPEKKSMAQAMLSMQGQTEALKKHAFEEAKRARQKRIDALARKRKDPSFTEELAKAATGATFSLGEDGVVLDSMDIWLSLMEKSTIDVPAALGIKPENVREHAHPVDVNVMTEERRKELVAQQARHAGVKV